MLFVPEDIKRSSYRGYVRVNDNEFVIQVSNVKHDSHTNHIVLKDAQLDVECALAMHLKSHCTTLKLRLAQASSLEGFAAEFEELLTRCCWKPISNQNELPSAKYYMRLLTELDIVGWNHLFQVSDDLRALELTTKDKKGRDHVIQLLLPLEYEDDLGCGIKPECLVDAPEPFELQWPLDTYRQVLLEKVLKQFERFLDKFQKFWNVLDALDEATCVLEPHHPAKATGRRRVALERHVSVQFEVDPVHPTAMLSELNFFGDHASVGILRERWSTASHQWDETKSLQKNLEDVLKVTFPSPRTTQPDEFAVECGICYSYRLEDEVSGDDKDMKHGNGDAVLQQKTISSEQGSRIPDRLCENAKCNRPFHVKCLFDWLRALPTSRQSFHTIFGECPYCREAISTKFQPES